MPEAHAGGGAETAAVRLHSVQFWDPDGSRACLAERGILSAGLSLALLAGYCGHWLACAAALALTAVGGSYVTTLYRLYHWRKHSGIAQQVVFNELYEVMEQVCTDTRMTLPSGEMKPRLVCAGELGSALNRHFSHMSLAVRLRFWIEACVHFRLTLRGGCHHLGSAKLARESLTSASVAMLVTQLPNNVCPSCDTKIAIESKFPLKCD